MDRDPVTAGLRRDRLERVRIVVRPIASPLALGFLALAVGSFVVAGYELSWVNRFGNARAVGLIVLSVPVPLQFVSAVVGFAARDVVAATGMGMLSGTWLATGLVILTGPPGVTSPALGLLLVSAATSIGVTAITAAITKELAGAVMGLASVRFYLAGASELTASPTWRVAAGACGIALAVLAVYAALAFEAESVSGRTVLPTGRRGSGRLAMAGTLSDQLAGIEHESGVRRQL